VLKVYKGKASMALDRRNQERRPPSERKRRRERRKKKGLLFSFIRRLAGRSLLDLGEGEKGKAPARGEGRANRRAQEFLSHYFRRVHQPKKKAKESVTRGENRDLGERGNLLVLKL